MRWLSVIVSLLALVACTTKPSATNKFSDPQLVKIYDLKDRRLADTLRLTFLKSENPVYRREATLAFGSILDSLAKEDLQKMLLGDPDAEVRRNAAFALGQTDRYFQVKALIPALEDKDKTVVREVLEALGKVGSKDDIAVLLSFQATDALLEEGQAWGLYQLALRLKTDSSITKKTSEFLAPSHPYQARLAAAHYFSRSRKIIGAGFEENLMNAALKDERPEVRMASTNGLRHLDAPKVLPLLKDIYNSDKDYRVRLSAIRACQNYSDVEIQELVLGGLKDSVEIVQVAASEVIRNSTQRFPSDRIFNGIANSKSQRVIANLYGSLIKTFPLEALTDDIIKIFPALTVYGKAAFASALGESKSPLEQKPFEFLSAELLSESNEKVVRTSAASAIVAINKKADTRISKKEFLKIYKQAIAQGDAGVIGIVCSALRNGSLHYETEIKDLSFLYDAKAKLALPKDIESLQPLEEAIAYLEGKTPPERLTPEFNHPIDWNLVKTIPPHQEVEIFTTKGQIVIQLLVEDAPGSVANFISLTNEKYFTGKFFHRVVPNFVVQAGCNRGDGYGSEDYSIRSEFSLKRFTTGSVGMASSGKDTEGTQWFVTHSPTPHLDGRYTNFAQVVSGMDVIDHIDVGDEILDVIFKK